MRTRSLHLLTALIALLCSAAPAHAQRRTIRLTVGQSEAVRVRGTITKVQVLNPSVADVANYSTRGATIVGVGAGSTELLVTTSRRRYKFTVIVSKVEVGRVFKQVRAFLGRIEGIYPRLIGDTIVLSGSALTADDYGRAQRAVRLFGNKVRNLVRFKPSAVEQVNQIFQRSGLSQVRARLVGGTIFLEGSVDSKAEDAKVKALLRSYGLNVENLVKIGGGKQILIDVQFVEMRKRGLKRIGIQWPSTFAVDGQGQFTGQIPISPPGGQQIQIQLASPITVSQAAVNLLFSTGSARLLAQPKLVCGSGKKAEFLVGGEVPIVVINNNAVNIDFKPFGIKLKVAPVADSLGNVQTDIFAEVSEPDRSLAVLNVPGFRTRRFKTSVSVKDGASIVLSGLFTNTEEKSVAKWPFLGHIPIIGELFKSREFQEQKTTLVVFVTPKVVSPKHPWVQKTIRNIQKLYRAYEDEVGWQVFD
ncbi:MAG: pilus assembly protein N-terminal domain-containing protein [Myxococcales bacterium]|nr:pilus assembly protein N-terminal domain-containing protein [Myxococcales bacterium]